MTAAGFAAGQHARALVFVDDLLEDAMQSPDSGAPRWIAGPDGHHLQRVRRLDVDERLVIADGDGRWYPARITETRPGAVATARAGADHVEPTLSPRLTVAFAPAKADHATLVVHQLVELGVDRIVPLVARHGVVRWDNERATKPLERLRRVAREAAMQCQRARIPMVDPPTTVAAIGQCSGLVLGDPDGGSLDALVPPELSEWVVVIGPEGGFAPDELADLTAAVRIAVGPHVLRSVTAPIALAAALATRRRS